MSDDRGTHACRQYRRTRVPFKKLTGCDGDRQSSAWAGIGSAVGLPCSP
jgi:hypothetical protein